MIWDTDECQDHFLIPITPVVWTEGIKATAMWHRNIQDAPWLKDTAELRHNKYQVFTCWYMFKAVVGSYLIKCVIVKW